MLHTIQKLIGKSKKELSNGAGSLFRHTYYEQNCHLHTGLLVAVILFLALNPVLEFMGAIYFFGGGRTTMGKREL